MAAKGAIAMDILQRFIKFDEDRINLYEIVSYGLATDEDDEEYLYIETKTSEDVFQYYAEDVDFDLEDKIEELDSILLLRKLGHVDFEET